MYLNDEITPRILFEGEKERQSTLL
jgi:hypothetical protein